MNNKQDKLNQFLIDVAEFFEKYYSKGVNEIVVKEEEDKSISITFSGDCNSTIEVTSCSEEITVIFSESHWHIDDYSEPCNMDSIYRNSIRSIMDILDLEVGTYSCWNNDVCLGGVSFASSIEDALQSARNTFQDVNEIRIKVWGNPLKIYK
ncbi:hypothetical protein [Spirulina sp. 06S082]|uniref:hypothetical protein n=1 Tax=Spirulina sp. 06S082 TaxID=3110248 RepID=UPI002B217A6E|nr:hypothetical protein [Spirulina sp. 06S082]MEA5468978.1 hypothetical protein [Spirulina sp. 06S082]